MLTRNTCIERDQQDPLAGVKQQFELPEGVIYLDGNSLGVLPKAAKARSKEVIEEEWGKGLVSSWNKAEWFEMPINLGNKLSKLIGAKENEVVVTDTTSLNVFKALAAAIKIQQEKSPTRKVIVSEREMFPTDLYMIQGLIELIQNGYELRLIDETLRLEDAINDDVAVLLLSHVNYRTGYLHDIAKTTALAHEHDVLTIWDLCHSAGAVPIDVHTGKADFVVGCTYKYLNGGPGSPAFIWVSPEYRNVFKQPLSGWWGHEKPFDMAVDYTPAHGVRRYLCGTQPIVSMALLECGLDVALSVEMEAVRHKSLALTDLFIELVETRCAGFGLELITPREHDIRGSHVSFTHPEGYAIIQALIERGVIGDYREPEVMRFGITPLYLSFTDIWDAVEILLDILKTKAWDQPKFQQRITVT